MRRFAPLLLPALAAACSDTGDRYPSLLPRAIEARSDAAIPRPVPVAEPDPALDARTAEWRKALAANEAGFRKAAQTAEARVAVAAGTAPGSEGWLDAQVALATLDGERSKTMQLSAEIDAEVIARGAAGQPPYPALQALAADTTLQASDQAARIARLEAALAGN